jgi:beta-carotene 15,15'-dioxygenase
VAGVERAALPACIPGDASSRRPLQAAALMSRIVVVAAIALGVGQVTPPGSSAALLIAGVGFLAGVPHGGVDHLMAMRLAGRSQVVVVAVYAVLAALAWAVLQWGGPVALLVVVTLSAVHFGLGELQVSSELTGWRPSMPVKTAMVVAGSGALLLPLARSGQQFNSVATAVSPGLARLIAMPTVRTSVLVLWIAAAVIAVAAALLARHGACALDVVLIGALGFLVTPLMAFAVWFGGWHAVRHSARMLGEEPGCATLLAQGDSRGAWRRLAGLAAPMSIAALVFVTGLAWHTATATDPTVALAGVLRLLLALTVPHMVVVWWLDRR